MSTVDFEPNSNLRIINSSDDNGTFANCTNLINIKLPQNVTLVGRSAFKGCQKLIDVYCAALIPPTISYNTFTNVSSAARFYVPMESVDVYKANAEWKKYASQIVGYNFTE